MNEKSMNLFTHLLAVDASGEYRYVYEFLEEDINPLLNKGWVSIGATGILHTNFDVCTSCDDWNEYTT